VQRHEINPRHELPDERLTSHGITATSGKIGAFVGTFAFPLLMQHYGLKGAMGTVAVVAIIGLLVTWAFLPEPKGESLEEISRDDLLRIEQAEHLHAAT
jgi:MFS transporter, PHS family, inorganic phosphate transporter